VTADFALRLAYPVANELGMTVDEILWNTPISRTMKILSMIQISNSERPIAERHTRVVNRRLVKELNERLKDEQ